MAKIVIKKRVSLDFLGKEYKEAYFVFRAIPLPDYKEFMKKLPESDDEFNSLVLKIDSDEHTDEDVKRFNELKKARGNNDEKSLDLVMDTLKEYFVSGEFPGEGGLEDVGKEDLDGIDQHCAMECFKALTGRLDPKVLAQ